MNRKTKLIVGIILATIVLIALYKYVEQSIIDDWTNSFNK